jgi:hypothetical protein
LFSIPLPRDADRHPLDRSCPDAGPCPCVVRQSRGEGNPDRHLLYARSLELQGKFDAALYEYAALVGYYPGQEARYRYALLLKKMGRSAEAQRFLKEICQAIEYGPRHQYREQREWYDLARRQLIT